MKMLSVYNNVLGWQWVVRRMTEERLNGGLKATVVTSPCKAHSLGTEDLEYFRSAFPQQTFEAREVLGD